MKVNDILTRIPSNILGADVSKLTRNMTSAAREVVQDNKFESRAKLEDSGLDRLYDDLQGRLTRTEIYKTTIPIAQSRLTAKQIALGDIQAAITAFRGETSDPARIEGSSVEKVNDTLTKIADILNRRENGRYIFGGRADNEMPVKGDITTLDEHNFTEVTSNEVLIDVSDTRSVDANMITARDIEPFIRVLNTYKKGIGPHNAAEIDKMMDHALKNHEYLQVKVGNGLNSIKKATSENAEAVYNANEVISGTEFTVNVVDKASAMQNSMQSLLANFSIESGIRGIFNKVLGMG